MSKAQSSVLGTVLITGIVISIVGSVLVWGKPLIDKSTDNTHIDNIINKMMEIDSAIRYVGETGSTRNIKLSLSDESFRIVNGEIVWETSTQVPIVATTSWAPINTYDLPTKNQILTIDTKYACIKCTKLSEDDNPKYGNITIDNEIYYVSTHNEGVNYKKACISKNFNLTSENCAFKNQKIYVKDYGYEIGYVAASGNEVVIIGKEVENIGILGKDKAGIIIGKSTSTKYAQNVFIKLVYRGLQDDYGKVIRYNLNCDDHCIATQGTYTLTITRESISETPSGTIINVNLELN